MTTETTTTQPELLQTLNQGFSQYLRTIIRHEVETFFQNGDLGRMVRDEALRTFQSEAKDTDDEHIKSLIEDVMDKHERLYDHDDMPTEDMIDEKITEHEREYTHVDSDEFDELVIRAIKNRLDT